MNYNEYKGIKITKRKDGRWTAKPTINGKQSSIYGKTQKECYGNLKLLFENNKVIKFEKTITFFEYWEFWYKTYKQPFYKEGTLKNYRSVFNNQIKPNFKNQNIKTMTALDINLYIKKLKDSRMKEYTTQYLKEVFKQAFKDRQIKFDISDDIIKYHHKRAEGTALTQEQRKILIENADKIEDGDIYTFYLYTGCRLSEALETTFDKDTNMLHIAGTKTDLSNRYIPVFSQIQHIIEKRKNNQPYLFNISDTTLKRRTAEMRKICEFHFNIKDLRTTFATMCAEKGISPKIIAKWLGHTTTNTTNKYYIKVLDNYEKEQAKLIDPNFDPKKRV